ncbi:hypothetical protein [Sulfitobacter dubius]|uniref:Helix-turn-helix domain-containing protein n=1 Tax=Sulfitobacter dubius TaxID=218673 RepID=A0ABY3ZIJ2_9RHOB|nr:hypothetical protein [Sulfitobacter dubius]UOA14494.1 hypothetical protein DSM109990_01300 [Sulfitobacter dubius]
MEPAASIISALGGPTAVAETIGIHRTRVSMWQAPRERGGTNGMIPYRHIEKIMEMARAQNVSLGPESFMPVTAPEDAA